MYLSQFLVALHISPSGVINCSSSKSLKSVPVLELLSNAHHVPAIQHWISLWLYKMSKEKPNIGAPSIVVVDYSFALLHASSLALNRCSLQMYLALLYRGEQPRVIISICCSHLIQAISRDPSLRLKQKRVKAFIMQAIGCLLVTRDMVSVDEIVKHLYTLLLSEVQTSQTAEALAFFHKLKNEKEFVDIMSDAAKVSVSPDSTGSDSLLKKSPYYIHFQVSYVVAVMV